MHKYVLPGGCGERLCPSHDHISTRTLCHTESATECGSVRVEVHKLRSCDSTS